MAQSLSNVLLHIVFSTKNRQAFIDQNIESQLYAYMVSTAKSCKSFVHSIGGDKDHVHLLLNMPRTISISELLEELKKNSSKWIKTKHANYKSFSWQKGFGAFSVSQSQKDIVMKYILNQKEHHKVQTFQDEFRKMLKLHEIEFDERYVWD